MALSEVHSPPDGPTVLLSEPVVRGVRQLAIDGFVALPRRGIEVGGVLLGVANHEEVQLEGFEEVCCEHRYGPSYALSVSDRATLSQLLAEWPGTKPPVVGFFRSFTSREPVIEAADEAFVQEHFPQGYFLYLMLQPLSVENCLASFRFFRDGRLLPESEAGPWPFAVTKNSAEPTTAPPLPPAAETVPVPTPVIARKRAHANDDESAPLRRARWWVPALMCLVSAAAGALINQLTNATGMPVREPRWLDLHLDAHPVDGQLEVRWDAPPRTLVATRGRLEVIDGKSRHEIELDAEQLRGRKLTYTPSNSEVRLRLSLDAKGSGIVEDAVRVKAIPEPLAKVGTKPSIEAYPAPTPEIPPAAQPSAASAPRPQVAVLPAEVHMVQPRIPEGIRARIAGPVVIPVEVEVSKQGHVVRAVAERSETDDSVHRYLAEQAQQAAMKWRFRPARMTSGDRIAASKTLRFVFTP